jgi:serine phosphatase RsbU (regulator of sigma subunit)/anti-sigma regulatory factor (Ser/Thr protein kinase)/transposase-like protein
MARKLVKEVFMTFPAAEGQLEDIRSSIRNVLSESELSDKAINSVLLAIEEACTNVVRHAYLYGPGSIRIKIKLYADRVVFSIFDRGRKFDFDHSEVPDLDRYVRTGRKGGLGLYLIRKMMDSVDYFSRDGENELRMEKKTDKAVPSFLRPKGISIRVKFALWASLVVFGIVAGVYLYFQNQVRVNAETRFFHAADNGMNAFVSDIGEKIILRDLDLTKFTDSWLKVNQDFSYIVVTDTTNIIIARPQASWQFLSSYVPLPSKDYNNNSAIADSIGQRQYNFKIPVKLRDNTVGYAYFGLHEAPLTIDIYHARRNLFLFSFFGLVIGFVAVFVLSNYFVKPIQKLTEGVMRIGEGNLDQTLPVDGADEFSEIARAFNEMTTKFKKAQENVVEQERLQKEMQVAQEIQHALLPRRFPDVEGYDISTVYRAAKDVGGDYFDFVQIDEDILGIIVADVSGKGVPGSLVMTMIRTALRLEARENYSPTDILGRVNKFVTDDVKRGMFITIFFITLDSAKRTISYSSAGHNPMILYRKESNSCYFLNTRGMPLGITLPDGVSFEDSLDVDRVKLKKDDMLVIYTDGITEAMNKAGEQYGNDRLILFIKDNAELAPDEFTKKLDIDLHKFTGGAPQGDDITLVVIKEKMMLDEVVFEKRKRLLEMVENENVPLEEACRQMGVSPTTYYKYRRRWQKLGDVGLLNKKLRADSEIRQVSYEVRKEILKFVRENPDFGSKRIMDELRKKGIDVIDQHGLYEELVRMRLNTRKLRLEYVERVGGLTPELSAELEKEILKDNEKKEEVDRIEYLDNIKKNLVAKKEQLSSTARDLVEKLQKMEPILGDTILYGEIAAELGKLRGGEDIAKLFESIILKMADLAKEKTIKDDLRSVSKSETKPVIDRTSQAGNSDLSSGEVTGPIAAPGMIKEQNSDANKLGEADLNLDTTPIDIVQSADKIDGDGDGEVENFDWESYEQKLSQKFKKQ